MKNNANKLRFFDVLDRREHIFSIIFFSYPPKVFSARLEILLLLKRKIFPN